MGGKQKKRPQCLYITAFTNTGGKGARTPDLLDAIETLSQLSYAPDSCYINVSESALPVKDHGATRMTGVCDSLRGSMNIERKKWRAIGSS